MALISFERSRRRHTPPGGARLQCLPQHAFPNASVSTLQCGAWPVLRLSPDLTSEKVVHFFANFAKAQPLRWELAGEGGCKWRETAGQ